MNRNFNKFKLVIIFSLIFSCSKDETLREESYIYVDGKKYGVYEVAYYRTSNGRTIYFRHDKADLSKSELRFGDEVNTSQSITMVPKGSFDNTLVYSFESKDTGFILDYHKHGREVMTEIHFGERNFFKFNEYQFFYRDHDDTTRKLRLSGKLYFD